MQNVSFVIHRSVCKGCIFCAISSIQWILYMILTIFYLMKASETTLRELLEGTRQLPSIQRSQKLRGLD
jgi:hypothetical protein